MRPGSSKKEGGFGLKGVLLVTAGILTIVGLYVFYSADASNNVDFENRQHSTISTGGNKPFPERWGEPPHIQTRDLGELPGGYGFGSSTLAKWIRKHMEEDAEAGLA